MSLIRRIQWLLGGQLLALVVIASLAIAGLNKTEQLVGYFPGILLPGVQAVKNFNIDAQQYYIVRAQGRTALAPPLQASADQWQQRLERVLNARGAPAPRVLAAYQDMSRQWQQMKQAGDVEQLNAAYTEFSRAMIEVDDIVQQLTHAATEQISDGVNLFSRVVLLVSLLMFVVAIVASVTIGRSIAMPISALAEPLRLLSLGDLRARFTSHGQHEIARLAQGLNQMTATIAGSFTRVQQEVTHLAEIGDEFAEISLNSSRNMLAQQHETQSAATAVTEMASSAHEVADQAEFVATTTTDLSALAQQVGAQVANSATKSGEVMRYMQTTSDRISSLADLSKEIAQVIGVIRGIAEQTNLLALNAAIEAARAGEQGRGFAVVADEVRTLATRSADSTNQIDAVINRLTQASQSALDAADQARELSEGGQQQGIIMQQGMEQMLAKVDTLNGMIQQIASSAHEQQSVTEAISQMITRISDLAGENAVMSEQVERDSQRIGQIIRVTREQVSQFKV